mgnify:CR=1 FL=1
MPDEPETSLTATGIASGAVMNSPISAFTPGGLAQAWLLLDLLEKLIEKRKEEFRKQLLVEAEAGEKEKSGSYKYKVDGNTVIKERRETKKLDLEKVQDLLLAKGLPVSAGCDQVVSWVPNYSKLAALVDVGKLSQDELAAVQGKVTWALKVQASEEFAVLLDQVKNAQKQLK